MTPHHPSESPGLPSRAGTKSPPARKSRAMALVFLVLALSPLPALADGEVYRYKGEGGAAVYTDDPRLIPHDKKSGVAVSTAPALPADITPPTAAEKAKAAEEKKKAAAERRDAQRKKTNESYKRLLEEKKQAAQQEGVEKARKAYDAEKARLEAEDAALKKELIELTALKEETESLEKRKRNPRMGRQYRYKNRTLEDATKSYEARRAALDVRLKAFTTKHRP